MGFFLTPSYMSFTILNKLPCSHHRSQALMELLYCSTEYVWGGSGLNGTPLDYNGKHNSFLPLCLLVFPSHPGVFGPKVLLSSQHCQAGWGDPGNMYFLLGSWQVEGSSLLSSHIFDLAIITAPICRADKRVKFFPSLWEPVIPLKISIDPLTRFVGIDISPFPWLLSFWGRMTVGAVEVTEAVVCLSGSKAWHSWESISFTQEGNIPFWGGGGSWFLLNKEASITSSPLMVINRAMHCQSSLMALHRMPVLAPDASAQACNTLAKASVFSCLITQRFWGSETEGESSVDKACVAQMGCPTTWRPVVVPLAA